MDSTSSDEDKRWLILVFICFVLSLTIPTFGIRIYVRVFIQKIFTFDDWMMVITSILYFGFVSCMTVACCNGLGAHTTNLKTMLNYGYLGKAQEGDVVVALQFFYLSTLLYVLTLLFLHIAIAFYLARQPDFFNLRPVLMIPLAVSTIASFAFFFGLLLQCSPITDYWSRIRYKFAGSCRQTLMIDLWYAFIAVSLAADLVLAAFGIATICKKDIRWSKRFMLAPVIAFAVVSITSGAMTFVYVPRLEQYEDLTWSVIPFAIWATITPSTGMVAANLATFGPWLKEISLFTTQPSMNMTLQAGRRAPRWQPQNNAQPSQRGGGCMHDIEWAGSPTQRLSSISN